MILITCNRPIDSVCCVCKDGAAALDYLRTISKKPLLAMNFKYGVEQKVRHDGEERFSECIESPCDWKYIVDGMAYYLSPIDYIE